MDRTAAQATGKHGRNALGRRILLVSSVCLGILSSVPAASHRSPPHCDGSAVSLTLQRSPPAVLVGGTVNYYVSAANQDDPFTGIFACDAEDIDVVFYCPGADGNPDFTMPQVFTTNLVLLSGTAETSIGTSTCTLDVNPDVFNAVAEVRLGDQSGALDSLSQGRLHDSIVDDPLRVIKQIGVALVTGTTSSTLANGSTSSTTTTLPPLCACDPGEPGSANRDCCSGSCTVIENRIGAPCGTGTPRVCELASFCSTDGRCEPTLIPVDPPTVCRKAFTNGRCDLGDVCDGRSGTCPTTGDQQCTTEVPDPPPASKEVEVLCSVPKQKRRGVPKCSAVGKEPAPSSLARRDGGASPLDDCGKQKYTPKVVASLLQSKDERFLERRVTLKLNPYGRKLLDEVGSVRMCVLVKIKVAGKILTQETRYVTLTQ